MGDEVVAIAFRKDDKDFKDRIDKAMDEMKKDGTCKRFPKNGWAQISQNINLLSLEGCRI